MLGLIAIVHTVVYLFAVIIPQAISRKRAEKESEIVIEYIADRRSGANSSFKKCNDSPKSFHHQPGSVVLPNNSIYKSVSRSQYKASHLEIEEPQKQLGNLRMVRQPHFQLSIIK